MQKYLKQGKYTYNEDDLLGEGSFGKVYRGVNNYTKNEVALKQIELSKIEQGEDMLKTILLSQISVMRKFNKKMEQDPCPFLVRQEDVFRTDKHIFIVMEICCGGTLDDQIRGKRFKEKECVEVLYCICQGLHYMSEMGIAHRDLKPENIFISYVNIGKGIEKKIYKIGDFGFASQKKQFDMAMGTFPYMAPEMFKKQKYTNKVDVWSLGVIAYQILFGGLYFVGKDRFEIQKNIKEKPFILSDKQKSKASPNYQDFMSSCLNKDPKSRTEIERLLTHPLFYEIEKEMTQIKAAINKAKLEIQKQAMQESKMEVKIFDEVSKPKQSNQHQNKSQNPQNPQILKQLDPKTSAFQKLNKLLQQIIKMRIMAQKFHQLQERTKRCTQFIQLYLLKDACAIMNKLLYTVMNRENHIQMEVGEFQEIFKQGNVQKINQFREHCTKEYHWVTGLYNEKYQWFIQKFITRYQISDQELIRKVINNDDPYELVNPQVFEKQLKKWKFVIDQDRETGTHKFKYWNNLSQECNRILEMKLHG